MKFVLSALFAAQMFAFSSHAATKKRSSNERLCNWFQSKEDTECAHIMCDDDIAAGTFKNLDDCTSSEDYAEAAQGGCEGQSTTVEKLVKEYNKKHHAHIKCDE